MLQNENKIHLNRSIVSGNNFNNPWSINNFCISLALFDYSNNPSLMTFLFSQFGTKFRSLKTTKFKGSIRLLGLILELAIRFIPVHVAER